MPHAILLKRRLNRVIELEKGVRDKRQRLKDQLSDIVHDAELNVALAESFKMKITNFDLTAKPSSRSWT